jgi:uncharacterized protein YgiB involved in biofilm formation
MRVKKTEWLKGNAEEYFVQQRGDKPSRAWENRRNECDRAVPRAVSRAKCAGAFDQGSDKLSTYQTEIIVETK